MDKIWKYKEKPLEIAILLILLYTQPNIIIVFYRFKVNQTGSQIDMVPIRLPSGFGSKPSIYGSKNEKLEQEPWKPVRFTVSGTAGFYGFSFLESRTVNSFFL